MKYRKIESIGAEDVKVTGTDDLEIIVISGNGSRAKSNGERAYVAGLNDLCNATTEGIRSTSSTVGTGCDSVAIGDSSVAISIGADNTSSSYGKSSLSVTHGEMGGIFVKGENSIGLANGFNSTAQGVMGSYLVLTEYPHSGDKLLDVQVIQIDGVNYQENINYTLKDGKVITVAR